MGKARHSITDDDESASCWRDLQELEGNTSSTVNSWRTSRWLQPSAEAFTPLSQ